MINQFMISKILHTTFCISLFLLFLIVSGCCTKESLNGPEKAAFVEKLKSRYMKKEISYDELIKTYGDNIVSKGDYSLPGEIQAKYLLVKEEWMMKSQLSYFYFSEDGKLNDIRYTDYPPPAYEEEYEAWWGK